MYDIIVKGKLHSLSIKYQFDLYEKIVQPITYMALKYWERKIMTLKVII